MPRPVNADSVATRQRILEKAVELFGIHGLAGVSIRSIAAASGVSLAMVHHYFGSKAQLHRACIDSMSERLAGVSSEYVQTVTQASSGETRVSITQVVKNALQFARENQVPLRLLLRETMEQGALDPKMQQTIRLPFLAQASEVLAQLIARDPQELRLPLQSLIFLIARYGTCSELELEQLSAAQGQSALSKVEEHLVNVAQSLILNDE